MLYGTISSSMFFLLFYEPLSILFETSQVPSQKSFAFPQLNDLSINIYHFFHMEFNIYWVLIKFWGYVKCLFQAIVVHGFQLLDIWLHHSVGNSTYWGISKIFDISAAGCSLNPTLSFSCGNYVHLIIVLSWGFSNSGGS